MNTGTKKRSAIIALLALIVGLVIPLTSPPPTAQAQTPTSERLTAHFTGIEFVATKALILHLPAVIILLSTT